MRVAAVMIFCVEGDHEREGDEPESGDAFDRRRLDLLDVEADLLREHAERFDRDRINIGRAARWDGDSALPGTCLAISRWGGLASAARAGYRSDTGG